MSPPDPWRSLADQVSATATPGLHRWREQLVKTIRLTQLQKARHLVAHGWDDSCGRPLLGLVELQLLLRKEPLPPL